MDWLNLDWLNLDWLPAAQRWLHTGLAEGIDGIGGSGGAAAYDLAALGALGFLFGALHALLPGHGKSILVSFHLGRDGRWFDGLRTASLLAIAHIGVAVLLVLTGMAVIGGAFARDDNAARFEIASAVLIALIGAYLVYRAARPHKPEREAGGGLLAMAAGVVPCPLTIFILTFAILRDKTGIGLVAIAAMLLGVIATLSIFVVGTVLARGRLLRFLDGSATWRARLGRALEFGSAIGVFAIGLLMTASRIAVY